MTRRAVVVVLDGLRRDMVGPETTPELHAFAAEATSFAAHRSVFPSATRVVSSCFATGCMPATHGLQGNSVALMEDGRLVPRDVGRPDFMDHWRRVRGRTFAVPTMAERLARMGRTAMVFNNVSPGAARAHDPDGHGWVFHRAWSHGPGLRPLAGAEAVADVTLDTAGDARLTGYFLERARDADLAVLWLGEPDHAQHESPLGSPEAMAAVAGADACFGRVRAAAAPDTLLIACSDHGHQTVGEVIDIDAAFAAAGLKTAPEEPGPLAVSNGTSALIYLHPDRAGDADAVLAFLQAQPWAGAVLAGDDLRAVGQAPEGGLLCAVSMRSEDRVNAFGVAGISAAARPVVGKPDRLGCGQHGGLGTFEQMPFLMIGGDGFGRGGAWTERSSVIDLAPTILGHLGVPVDGCEGRALQDPRGV
ncbi:MAG TPA: alkaline phosphatase family protein [Rhodopila sp.]|uniref:alkaline phosphatase family protein n=1 Tax=Rhodopila sp. TaxID=2480087 RepID=UPI002BB3D4A0|nr:alkaline phosphatase family protein [Rhodopila sp.]HVY14749.1 alkaline phosphatase family protein [Rhodopila sp.]